MNASVAQNLDALLELLPGTHDTWCPRCGAQVKRVTTEVHSTLVELVEHQVTASQHLKGRTHFHQAVDRRGRKRWVWLHDQGELVAREVHRLCDREAA